MLGISKITLTPKGWKAHLKIAHSLSAKILNQNLSTLFDEKTIFFI